MADAIDISHLEKYVFGDRALLDEILTIFVDQAEMLIGRFSPEVLAEDWRLNAHTLKGAARGVGAWSLGDLAEEAEGIAGAPPEAKAAMIEKIRATGRMAINFAISYRDNSN